MVHTMTCNAFGEQTYVVDHGDGKLTVVDPGMSNPSERASFIALCHSLSATPVQVLLTHGHLDHVMGCQWMTDEFGLQPRVHLLDEETYHRGPFAAQMYGVSMDSLPEACFDLSPGETIPCGQANLEVRFTPGHAPGHVVFVCHDHGWLLGETCFSKAALAVRTCLDPMLPIWSNLLRINSSTFLKTWCLARTWWSYNHWGGDAIQPLCQCRWVRPFAA